MATHSSIFSQRIPWTDEPDKKLDTTEATQHQHTEAVMDINEMILKLTRK